MSIAGFGKPKYGGGNFTKNFKLQTDKNGGAVSASYRVLPPMKSCAETGEWAVYGGTHFGYKGVNQKDPSKPTHRPFKCIEDKDWQTKMVRQDCPECDLRAQREEEKKTLEAKLKAEGHDDGEIRELLKPHNDWLFEHSSDRKWKMNVRTPGGEFGTLAISNKTKKKLEAKILSLQTEDGIDALDLEQGVWFKFTRTGKGIEAEDSVDVEWESVRDANGRVSRTVKLAPLTEAEAQQALKDCEDLKKTIREISYEQIKLLTQCSGDPEDVDAILALGQKKESSAPPRPNPTPASRPVPPPAPPKPTIPTPAPPTAPAEEDDEEAAALAALAAIKARKAAAAVAAAQTTTEAAPTAPVTPAPAASEGLPVDRAAFMARFKKPAQ